MRKTCLRQFLRSPPEFELLRQQEIGPFHVALTALIPSPSCGDRSTKQPFHLPSKSRNCSPVTTRTLQPKLPHKGGQRTSELQLAFAGSYSFGRHPNENKARVGAIR